MYIYIYIYVYIYVHVQYLWVFSMWAISVMLVCWIKRYIRHTIQVQSNEHLHTQTDLNCWTQSSLFLVRYLGLFSTVFSFSSPPTLVFTVRWSRLNLFGVNGLGYVLLYDCKNIYTCKHIYAYVWTTHTSSTESSIAFSSFMSAVDGDWLSWSSWRCMFDAAFFSVVSPWTCNGDTMYRRTSIKVWAATCTFRYAYICK